MGASFAKASKVKSLTNNTMIFFETQREGKGLERETTIEAWWTLPVWDQLFSLCPLPSLCVSKKLITTNLLSNILN